MTPPGYHDEAGSWHEFRRLVLHELDRANNGVDELHLKIAKIELSYAQARGMATICGAVAGSLVAIAIAIIGSLIE